MVRAASLPCCPHWAAVIAAGCVLLAGCKGPPSAAEPAPPEPAAPESTWQPAEKRAAIAAGAKVILKHQCTRCHVIDELPGIGRPFDCVSCHKFLKNLDPKSELYHRLARHNGAATLERYRSKITHLLELPSLSGLGERVRADWIAGYLAAPHDLRPLLEESMIRNQLTQAERETVARYFAAKADAPDPFSPRFRAAAPHPKPTAERLAEGERLYKARGCPTCHVFGSRRLDPVEDSLAQRRAVALLAPDLRYVRERTRPERLIDWIADPVRLKPDTKMPKMVQSRAEAAAIADFLLHGDPGALGSDPKASVAVPPPVKRPVGWAEVKAEVLGHVCVHCHMNDHERDTGPGNGGGLGYKGIGLGMRTYERLMWGAVDPKTGERYSVLQPREGEALPPIVDAMVRRRVENLRDKRGLHDKAALPGFGEGRLGMPLGLPAMSDEQIGLLRAWIAQGCPGPTEVTGKPGKDDGLLVPDGPIAKNHGCELRAPADPPPPWSVRARRAAKAAMQTGTALPKAATATQEAR